MKAVQNTAINTAKTKCLEKDCRWVSISTDTGTKHSTADCLCIQQYCHIIWIRKVGKSGLGVKLNTQSCVRHSLSNYLHLPYYPPTYLHAHLPTYLPTHLPTHPPTHPPTYLPTLVYICFRGVTVGHKFTYILTLTENINKDRQYYWTSSGKFMVACTLWYLISVSIHQWNIYTDSRGQADGTSWQALGSKPVRTLAMVFDDFFFSF